MGDELDKNKSPLTLRITSGAELYLKCRGFKPIETEVSVDSGWLADLAAVTVPTQTELQNMKIVKTKPRHEYNYPYYREKYGNEYYKNDEFKAEQAKFAEKREAWLDTVKAIPNPLTALVEVKVTRGDFQRDNKWNRPSPVNLRYLAVPAGLLKRSEYPPNWFLLEFGAEGNLLRLAQIGTIENVPVDKQMWTIHEIAVRRHHRTEYAWLSSVMKKQNARMTADRQNTRVSNVVRSIKKVLYGASQYYSTVEDCFGWHGIKFEKLSPSTQDEVRSLWGKLKKDENSGDKLVSGGGSDPIN